MRISPLQLGASLYVPAVRPDIAAVANGDRYPDLKSVILCTEDSILPGQLEAALHNLREGMPRIVMDRPLVFVRPRDPKTLARIVAMRGVEQIDGFVLPKATQESVVRFAEVAPERFLLMPTLETREMFDPSAVAALRKFLSTPGLKERILALRIGGNDLLNLLGVRRRPGRTIYDTAVGLAVSSLVTAFRPFGFSLTAPVFDDFGDLDTLRREVARDLEHGLIGKTAIHPLQVAIIEREYRVDGRDLAMARDILAHDAPAVFQVDQVMCEPATHIEWARSIIERFVIYGVVQSDDC
ncbi:MAG: HpcH/HpaI aldolase/citrate lyase family protein [Magnetococcales bacterium]|nr:HpcH/HpaI aldolase/citrate lyase family protein [Magnetococcales bacterium]